MDRTPSRRIEQVDLPIIPTIAQLVRDHPGTISLGQGVVNYGPPAEALAAIGPMSVDPVLQKYQAVIGMPSLTGALREKLARDNGIDTSGAEVMVTAGSNMAFLNAVIAVADEGDEIILPRPYYFNQEMAIRMVGCVPVFVDTTADFQLDVPAIAAAIGPRTRAIVTVSPNNPTGAVYAEADLRAVNALCRDRGLWHFSDEAYEWFVHDGATHFSPASIPGEGAHTLSFFSFSKTFGMASWRIGYVVYPASLSEAMNKVQDTNLICAPVVSQVVAAQAVRLGRPAVQPHLERLSRVRGHVHAALRELGDLVEFPATRGAFYVLMKLPGVDDALEFNRVMVRDHRVATIPGFAFGLTDTKAANWQRLSYGALDEATVREGVSRFVRAVRAWYGRG
jgi:aspartate/methionine/tyrosine aminotransferase